MIKYELVVYISEKPKSIPRRILADLFLGIGFWLGRVKKVEKVKKSFR